MLRVFMLRGCEFIVGLTMSILAVVFIGTWVLGIGDFEVSYCFKKISILEGMGYIVTFIGSISIMYNALKRLKR